MKKAIFAVSFMILFASCGSVTYIKNILKHRYSVQQAVDWKEEMYNSSNPAFEFEKTQELKENRIRIENIKVKDITSSDNVDYKFCVKVTVPTSKGDIDCYVYSGTDDIFPKEDIKTISKLKKGITIIDIEGDFSRFFTLFDGSYTKIEIVNAGIDIKGN